MRAARIAILLAIALVMHAACSDDETVAPPAPPNGPSPEEIEACRAIAEKDCAAFEACAPVGFANLFVSQDDCLPKNMRFWAGHLFGPGSGATVSGMQQCGQELDLASCDDWWLWNFAAGADGCLRAGPSACTAFRLTTLGSGPDACFPHGERPTDAFCGAGSQCASGLCRQDQSPGVPCGSCQDAAQIGDECPNGTPIACAGAATCEMQQCAPLAGTLEPCGVCLPHLTCFGQLCRLRPDEGDACDPGAHDFARSKCGPGLICNTETAACEPVEPQALGAPCGDLGDGHIGNCEAGARCRIDTQPGNATCVAAIPLGEPCDTGYLFGNGCEYPGDCVDNRCQIRGPWICEP